MVLEQVTEIWMETPKTAKGQKKAKPVNKERFVNNFFIKCNVLYALTYLFN